MAEPAASPPQVPLSHAVALTLVAGGVGWAADRLAVHQGWRFPSAGYLAAEVVWKLVTIGLLFWAIRHYEGRGPDAATLGFGPGTDAPRRPFPTATFVFALVVAIVLAATVGSSATNANAFGTIHRAGAWLIAAEVLIRYPLTVFSEEALFRGWLQPRLGPNGLVLSAILWGMYHLQQASTIPSLIVFGLGLGALRWWKGNVRASAGLHYISDVAFFLTTYV